MKQSFFWSRNALREQKGVGGNAQGGMVVKAAPTAALEIAEAKLLLELLIVALDAPAQLGEPYQLLARCVERQRAQEILGWFGCTARPFNQQPLFGIALGAPIIVMQIGRA